MKGIIEGETYIFLLFYFPKIEKITISFLIRSVAFEEFSPEITDIKLYRIIGENEIGNRKGNKSL